MIISSLLIALKLLSTPAKAMVNLEKTRRVTVNLLSVGKNLVLHIIGAHHTTSNQSPGQHNAQPASTEYLVHNWLEASFARIQMIILWHDTTSSLNTIFILFPLYILLKNIEFKFYPTILITIFVYNLIKVWFRYIWPEIRVTPDQTSDEESRLDVDRWTHLHPQLMTLAELSQFTGNLINSLEAFFVKMMELRRQKPLAFYGIVVCSLSLTAILGQLISGFALIFSIIIITILALGIYLRILPEHLKQHLRDLVHHCQALTSITTQPVTENASPEASTKKSADPDMDLAATSSSSLSLYEQVIQACFLTRLQPEVTSKPEEFEVPNNQNKSVPIVGDELNEQISTELSSVIGNDQTRFEDNCNKIISQSYDDLSSNESASLIDSEEDQQDGFVIL